MPSNNIIALPIKSYVKKFIIKELGEEPIYCSQRNLAGRQILNLLSKRCVYSTQTPSIHKIELQIVSRINECRGRLQLIAANNQLFEDYFNISLVASVNSLTAVLGSRQKAIVWFFTQYDIEEHELSVEAVERRFHKRQKAKGGLKKKYKHEDHINLINSLNNQTKLNKKKDERIKSLERKVAITSSTKNQLIMDFQKLSNQLNTIIKD